MSEPTWSDPDLESALVKCRQTHTGNNPCRDSEYLLARFEYHEILAARGLLRPGLAEKRPA